MTTVMPEGFDIQKVPAIILIGEVVQEDILGIQAEFITAGKYNSASDLLDHLVREEAQALYPDAKLVGYSTRCCNHYQRQHCYILAKKDSEEE